MGLFGYAAYLFIDPKPGPTINDKLEVAQKYLNAGRADPAMEILNALLLEDSKLQPKQEGAVRMLLSEGLDVFQKEKHISVAKNHQSIIEQMKLAGRLGIKPDARGIERLARSYEALGRTKDALAQYQQLEAMGGELEVKWLKKVTELQLLMDQREQAAVSLEKYLEVKNLADGEKAWALGEKAHIQIDKGEFAVGRELMTQAIKLTDEDDASSPRVAGDRTV